MGVLAALRNRRARTASLTIAFILLFVVLLHAPVAEVIGRLRDHELARHLPSMRLPLLVTAAAALGLCVWLARRRRYAPLGVCAGVALVLTSLFAVYKFQQHYPRADLFSVERLRDSAAIVLGTDIRLSRFQPHSQLIVERTPVMRAAYRAIDIHFHLGSLPASITPQRLVQAMDATGIDKVVNLDGSPGRLEHFARVFQASYPDRFVLFAKPSFGAVLTEARVAEQSLWLAEAARIGARGIKISKNVGLMLRDESGRLVPLDDPRLDPIWEAAAALGMPVLVHSADPPAFFLPIDATNERYEELSQFPQWSVHGADYPSFSELMKQRERLLARHPATMFIGAHVGSNEDDLAYAARMLDRFANYYVDISSRVAALGRQPYTARRFFIRHQDRILFGTDGGYGLSPDKDWTPERFFRSHIEFLETGNEFIEYPLWGTITQGRWQVTGLQLPDEVLEKIYVRNAERLLSKNPASTTRLSRQ